jgi:flagellar basal-body rod protein FlgB
MNNIIDVIDAGIRAEGLRQKVIAGNVANLETPGFRRSDIHFKDLLAKALDAAGDTDLAEVEAEVFQPNNTPIKSNGNNVSLEVEVGEMVKNTLRHKTYIRLLQKKYAQMELAMNTR